jgi:NAD(P)-dependent dehydrogenase (short-subunit alcohol dehydrogenase family)
MTKFANKVAVITGGARGIGLEAALELARGGASIAIADRKIELAEAAANRCRATGVDAAAFLMDQSAADSVAECISRISEKFGHLDLLFANAGTGKFAPLVDMKKEDWDNIIQINLSGTFYVCQEVARRMIEQGKGGKIVLTASSGAAVVCDQLGAYCASKAGVMMLMKHLAAELGNYRINVNAILPGVIATGMTAAMLNQEELRNMLIRQTPVGRWGQPSEVAKLVAFLLSEDASYINGEGIMIDGGSALHGFPRWYSLDYTKQNECDWNGLHDEYPYKKCSDRFDA